MHQCHATLATYLYDLEARHEIPIRYQRWCARYTDPAPFRKEIEIFGPLTGGASEYRLPYKDAVAVIDVVHGRPHTGEPVQIVVGEEQIVVASVEGRRIRLAFDLEKLFEQPEDIQPGLVLEMVLGAAMPAVVEYVRGYDWGDEKQLFSDWMVNGVDGLVRGWRGNIRDNEYECNRLTSQITGLVRKNAELADQIVAVQATTAPALEKKAAGEFQALLRMMPSPVTSLNVEHHNLVVVLEPLVLEHEGNEYEMGSYTLTIGADKVRIMSDRGHTYCHPHVSSDSVPCWGSIGPGVGKLLGEGQYAALVAVIWEFLHSYNERDAYRHIQTWDPDWSDDDD